MKTEKPDFQKHAGTFISQLDKTHSAGWRLDNYSLINAIGGICDAVYEKHVVPLQSRVSELERENAQQKEWLEAYKKSNAEFMKSTTDQKFEKDRIEKEVETLRKALSLIRDMDDDIETEHGDPGDIAIRALAEHLDKNSTGE